MMDRDYSEMIGGGALVAIGSAAALYASSSYSLGTVTRMGPGMIPTALGWILAGLGVILIIQAFFRRGTWPEVRVMTPIFIFGSILAFALIVGRFGLVPAVIASTVISSIAELEFKPFRIALLSAALSVTAWAIFIFALGLPIPIFAWPL